MNRYIIIKITETLTIMIKKNSKTDFEEEPPDVRMYLTKQNKNPDNRKGTGHSSASLFLSNFIFLIYAFVCIVVCAMKETGRNELGLLIQNILNICLFQAWSVCTSQTSWLGLFSSLTYYFLFDVHMVTGWVPNCESSKRPALTMIFICFPYSSKYFSLREDAP